MKNKIAIATLLLGTMITSSCSLFNKGNKVAVAEYEKVSVQFNADSAYRYCEAQCSFGPRTMNSEAHDRCGEWIKQQFQQYGCVVESQKADLNGFDGTVLKSENIIARLNPDAQARILLCAHWDSRPWADNDPDEANHKTPVMAANDGASGVAVMLEVARVLTTDTVCPMGIDFVCFDAEDWGTDGDEDSWALGAQHWANNVSPDVNYVYGILLDMVGGKDSQFYQEFMSKRFASSVVNKVWDAAQRAGYGSYFPRKDGGAITDDHVPVNEIAHIPCIDIIPYFPNCEQSSFGPTWHTVSDTMDNIDPSVLKAVGQTLLQVILE